MQKITTLEQLKKEILFLEIKQAQERALLKEQFHIAYESLKPGNLIKKTISDMVSSPDMKNGLLNSALSMAAGYFTKKAVVGSKPGIVKNVLGSAIQMLVTKFVAAKTKKKTEEEQREADLEEESEEYKHQYTPESET